MEVPTTAVREPDLRTRHARVVVVGAGFAGLGMAVRLKQAGVDFVVLERADDVGGTWRDNCYPGAACDAPSHLYSFSFDPNPGWSRTFSPQPEILDYMRACARRFGVLPHIRFGEELLGAEWDEEDGCWRIETSTGTWTADVLVSAMGAINEPSIPSIPGLETFSGTMFHSSRWDHVHDMTADRVAVIGTGASAAQFVPHVQRAADRLHVFQRTPPWILPRNDRTVSRLEQMLFRRFPLLQRLVRGGIYCGREIYVLGFSLDDRLMGLPELAGRLHLRRQVPDRALRRKLLPDYRVGCKRIIISNEYYPALAQPNVEVVTDAIREVRGSTIVTEDGAERVVDTIVLATGFEVAEMPAGQRLRGRDGRRLSDVWGTDPQAYLGTTVAGFPNLFLLIGPNTILGHTSMVYMIESQVAYVMDALRKMDAGGCGTVEVRPFVQQSYNRRLQARMRRTVWASGCQSWYLNAKGHNTTLWPGFTLNFRRQTRKFDPTDYRMTQSPRARREALAGAAS